MTSKFYIISLGPGNPELITIQGLRALDECEEIFVPVRSKTLEWEGSVAYRILTSIKNTHKDWFKDTPNGLEFIDKWENKLTPIYTPMSYSKDSWKSQVEQIVKACKTKSKVGFVTLGDAAVFSSAYYLLNLIKDNHSSIYDNIEVVPGITSISYGSAKVKKPLCLGNSSLEIVPMHKEEVNPTKVYMRLHKGDDLSNLKANDLYYFENMGLENEMYGAGSPGIIENYLTFLIDFAGYSAPSEKIEEAQK